MNYWLIPFYLILAELMLASIIGFILSGFKLRPAFFWLFSISSWIMSATAYFPMAFIAPLFIGADGKYKGWFKYWGTPDNPATGDPEFWPKLHPSWSQYKLAWTWMWRNPAQGFDQIIKANVTNQTPVKVYGNLDISDGVYGAPVGGWFFITGGGVFQFSAIIPTRFCCIDIGLGWRLEPIAKKYETRTLGALIATPMRFFRLKA